MQALLALFVGALLTLPDSPGQPMSQSSGSSSNGPAPQASQREQSGLHGPVRSVDEETTYPAQTLGDGSKSAEIKISIRTEYDGDGRIVAIRNRGSSPSSAQSEWVTRNLYSPAGLLLKTISGKEGEPPNEKVYHYDAQDRLLSATDSRRPEEPIEFHYDANGRKSRVVVVPPAGLPSGTRAVSMSFAAMFEAPERSPALSEGGTATTLYDEEDRLTEIQLRDAAGKLISRTMRVYDERGNITEERQTMDDPVMLIPASDQARIFAEAGASAQDLRDQLRKFLGGSGETYSARYQYDGQGRPTLTIRNVYNHALDRMETSYNEHGDVARETTQSTESGGENKAETSRTSEVLYSYEYDSRGNWTVKRSRSRELPDGQFREGSEVRRTIEYF